MVCIPLTPSQRRRRLFYQAHKIRTQKEWCRLLSMDESKFSLTSDSGCIQDVSEEIRKQAIIHPASLKRTVLKVSEFSFGAVSCLVAIRNSTSSKEIQRLVFAIVP